MSYFIGTDIGGTFTDLVMLSDAGDVTIVKAPTTPENRTQGVLDALDALRGRAVGLDVESLVDQLAYSRTARPRRPTPSSSARARAPACSPPRDSPTSCASSAAMSSWAGMAHHEISHFPRARRRCPSFRAIWSRRSSERVDYRGEVIAPLDEADARGACARWSTRASRRSRSACCGRSAIPRTSGAWRRSSREEAPRRVRHGVVRAGADHRRVRAHLDDRDQRLSRSGHPPLHQRARRSMRELGYAARSRSWSRAAACCRRRRRRCRPRTC